MGPVQGPPHPPKDPLVGRKTRRKGEPYHIEAYAPRWIEPGLSQNPNIDHQIQSVRIVFECIEDCYRDKVEAGSMGPGDAEFRLRGLLDTLRTLRWLKVNIDSIKRRIEGTA